MVAAGAMVMVLVVVERRVEMVAQWLGLRAGLPGLTWMAARTHLATYAQLDRRCDAAAAHELADTLTFADARLQCRARIEAAVSSTNRRELLCFMLRTVGGM